MAPVVVELAIKLVICSLCRLYPPVSDLLDLNTFLSCLVLCTPLWSIITACSVVLLINTLFTVIRFSLLSFLHTFLSLFLSFTNLKVLIA